LHEELVDLASRGSPDADGGAARRFRSVAITSVGLDDDDQFPFRMVTARWTVSSRLSDGGCIAADRPGSAQRPLPSPLG
jgi:hypothetical protein